MANRLGTILTDGLHKRCVPLITSSDPILLILSAVWVSQGMSLEVLEEATHGRRYIIGRIITRTVRIFPLLAAAY
jgi:hypothetical protein